MMMDIYGFVAVDLGFFPLQLMGLLQLIFWLFRVVCGGGERNRW